MARDDDDHDDADEEEPEEPEEEETSPVKDDIFAPIHGHGGAKAVIASALKKGDVHILMVGPPGCGKSTFMMSLDERVPGTVYRDGRSLTESKLRDQLAEDPPILMIDEIDSLDTKSQKALATPMEHGRVIKDNQRDSYDEEIGTQIIAACNHPTEIIDRVRSRFRQVEFEAYDESEYESVCGSMLPAMVEWVETEEDAKEIARITREATDTTDPRDARDVARLSDSMEDVERMAKAIHDPEAEVGHTELTVTDIQRASDDVERVYVREIVREEIMEEAGVEMSGEDVAAAHEEATQAASEDAVTAAAPADDEAPDEPHDHDRDEVDGRAVEEDVDAAVDEAVGGG